jgi:ERCC4-type nuclease
VPTVLSYLSTKENIHNLFFFFLSPRRRISVVLISLDKGIVNKKENNGIKVTPTNNSVPKSSDNGLTIMYVDVHEPIEIVERLQKEKGIYVIRKALPVGDYCFSNIGIERKTLSDFYNSIVHGDKHIWKQLFNLKHAFERPILIVERWDDTFLSSPNMEKTIRGAIAAIVLMGITVLVIPGKGQNIKPFVDQLAYLFFSSDKKALSMRPIPEKAKLRSKKDIISDIICMLPEWGRAMGDTIASRVQSVEEICKMTDEDLKKICPNIGPKRLAILRWIFNGQELPKNKKPGEG